MKRKILLLMSLVSLIAPGQVYKNHSLQKDRISIHLSEGSLHIIPLTENVIRIRYETGQAEDMPELILINRPTPVKFTSTENDSILFLNTELVTVTFNKQNCRLSFADNAGNTFLKEKADSRKLLPDSVMGESCFIAEQSFESPGDEYLFGLGQFQDGHYNLKGISRRLTQVNSQISIPFIYSSKGYGLLWHQYGLTDFNPADNFTHLEKQEQITGNNKIMEVTTTSGTQKISQDQSLYEGKLKVPQDGVYSVFLDLGNMGNRQYVAIDGEPCIDQSNFWLPPTTGVLVELETGEHQVQVICKSDNTPAVSWKLKDDLTTFRSHGAKLLDYVVFYGPSADSVIASYRKLSGDVPMLPLWAYGFWQCRERYTSGAHLIETVKEFRKRKLPMDVIVQDWQYWGNNGWGVPKFDEANYHDPAGFIKEIHELNARFNISIWSNPDKNSTIGQEFVAKNLYIPNSKWLDYFNPITRETYWNTLKENLFRYGVDSWWMDATEPENDDLRGKKTYMGAGDFYRLTYPLMVSKAVYEGQRKTTSDKRVCILTRSAFLGQQRYGTINWSGDVGGTWDTYKRQIVAGLNYTITGLPYWTTDIGGFFRPGNTQYTDEKYHELLTRWFQWGTFNPIFRIHGYQSETEPWKYGQQAENNMRKMLDLRYRLLPYIYSEAWQVTKNGSTIMRPMVMDFSGDISALKQPYEYMFGKALLIAPITEPDVNEWDVYLPQPTVWYDFWTGKQYKGGQTIRVDVPMDIIPIFVKAGSIIPMGKLIQYTGQKSVDTLEIRIYQGANGSIELYEDEGDNYNYENGNHTIIPIVWNEQSHVLTIGQRQGNYTGCLKSRIFNIIFVNESEGSGISISPVKKSLLYTGKEIELKTEY